MSFVLELFPAARRDFKKLPRHVQEKLLFVHLPTIQSDPYKWGRPLAGAFKGERSYHFGGRPEYRVIYFIDGKTIIVTVIGTREQIYKKARGR